MAGIARSVKRFAICRLCWRDEHRSLDRTPRRASGRRRRRLFDHFSARLFAFSQRHDAVAAARTLSDAKGRIRAQLRPDRADHADLAADLLGAAAGGRALCRPSAATLFARDRHGCHLYRLAAAGERRQLPDAGLCGGIGRRRLRSLPSGGLAGGADGLGRPPWLGAVAVPGRRQCRIVARAGARSLYRDPTRSVVHRLVLGRGLAGDGGAVRGGGSAGRS